MRILAIGAHPDDIEVGCAGTLLKYADYGHDVFMLVMTTGEMGGDAQMRKNEQIRAAEILKIKDLIWGGYRDTQLSPQMNQIVYDIEILLKKIKPDFTLIHYGDDTHQDHRALHKATVSATRYIKNVLFFEGPTTQNFSPSIFVDIKESIQTKIECLMAHQSQVMKTNIEGLSIKDAVHATAVFRGIQGRVQFAEAFVPLRLFINI